MKFLFSSIVILFGLISLSLAYEYGPPDARVGNPITCTECHDSFTLNSGTGTLNLTGLPTDGYTPGQSYSLQVSLQQTGQRRWGFELSPVLVSNTNVRGGTLTVTDAVNTQLSPGSGNAPQYIKHTTAGTNAGFVNGPNTWTFQWTAPVAGSGTVRFYVAGNAANNSNTSLGDYIYNHQFNVAEAVNRVADQRTLPKTYQIVSAYPNPFNPATTVRINAPVAGTAKVAVYDLNGRLVRELHSGYLSTGAKQFTFDARNLSSAVYIVRVTGQNYNSDKKLVLLK